MPKKKQQTTQTVRVLKSYFRIEKKEAKGQLFHKEREQEIMPKNRPPFVEKVWSLVNDASNHDYINWMPDGESFYIVDKEGFEREILPKYFKHCKFSSFIRQLNMYGWHKVLDINSGAINSKETWQFKSPYFLRDREDLLDNIIRNSSGTTKDGEPTDENNPGGNAEVIEPGLKADVSMLKRVMGEEVLRLKKENQLLWQENLQHRENFEKIFRFLASVYGNQGRLPFDANGNNYSSSQRNQRLLTQNAGDEDSPEHKISQIIELNNNNNNNSASNSPHGGNNSDQNNTPPEINDNNNNNNNHIVPPASTATNNNNNNYTAQQNKNTTRHKPDDSFDMTNQMGNLELDAHNFPNNLLQAPTPSTTASSDVGDMDSSSKAIAGLPNADSVIQSITGGNSDFLNDPNANPGNMSDIGINFDDFIIDPSYGPNEADTSLNSISSNGGEMDDTDDSQGPLKRKRTS